MLRGDKAKKKSTLGITYIITFWAGSCLEAQYLALRSVLFVSNLTGNFQLRQLRKLFKIFEVHAVIFSSNHLILVLFHSALFSRVDFPTWSMTEDPRVILASWDQPKDFRALRFLFLKRCFGIFEISAAFSFDPYFPLPVALEVQIWTWSSSVPAVPTATWLGFQEAPPSFQEAPPKHFQPGPTPVLQGSDHCAGCHLCSGS